MQKPRVGSCYFFGSGKLIHIVTDPDPRHCLKDLYYAYRYSLDEKKPVETYFDYFHCLPILLFSKLFFLYGMYGTGTPLRLLPVGFIKLSVQVTGIFLDSSY